MGIIDETIAIAEKETHLALRYKIPFFSNSLISPLIRILPFILIYAGFYSSASGVGKLGGFISSETFIPFLMLGITADIFFFAGYQTFSNKFRAEKYWQTMEIILLAPINRLSIITGVGLADLISVIPSLVMFLGIAYFFYPIQLTLFFVILIVLLMLFLLCLSIGLITGCATLFNENYGPLFDYARIALVLFSCFYYPREVLRIEQLGFIGEILPTIAWFNPIYQANYAIRSIWFEGIVPLDSMLYLTFFAVVSPLAAVYIFKKLWKIMGIQGY